MTKIVTILVVLTAFIIHIVGLSNSSSYFTYSVESDVLNLNINSTEQSGITQNFYASTDLVIEEGFASISVTNTADKSEATIGDEISYKYEVTNTGDTALDYVILIDDNATSQDTSDDIEVNLYDSADYNNQIASLEPGQVAYGKTSRVVAESDLPGPLVNSATAKGTSPSGLEVSDTGEESVTIYELVLDTTPPVIDLLGDSNITLELGSEYNDAGATAFDDIDGDITSSIVVDNTVDTSMPGIYKVTYNVSDSAGNKADEVVRTVEVIEETAPPETVPEETTIPETVPEETIPPETIPDSQESTSDDLSEETL